MIDEAKRVLRKHSYLFLPVTVILAISVIILIVHPGNPETETVDLQPRDRAGKQNRRAPASNQTRQVSRDYGIVDGRYLGEHLIVPLHGIDEQSVIAESGETGDQVTYPIRGGSLTVTTEGVSTGITMQDRRELAAGQHVAGFRGRGFVASTRHQGTSNVQLVDVRGTVVITVQVATTRPHGEAVRIAERVYQGLRLRG